MKFLLIIAPLGHAAEQVPQPLHIASLIVETLLSLSKEMALNEHSEMHVLHPEQKAASTKAVVGSTSTFPLLIIDNTRPAAADA